MTDYITGLHAAYGAVLALMARDRTGRGQCIDAALYECAFNFMEPWIPAFEKLGHVAGRTGSRLSESTPNNLYPTVDSSHIHITAMADPLFRRLATVMGRTDLADDPRFARALERNRNADELDRIIAGWTGARPLAEIEQRLEAAGVPATRIYTIADIFRDRHFAARGSIAAAPDDDLGTIAMAAPVPRLSATPGAIRHAGRAVGADTRAVLAGLLGYDGERIADLARQGVIRCAGEPAAEPAGDQRQG
jgi:crotonobetainyl-CoA:carnitine CoA-transferase CaiB-like acyl-CoA transferase